MTPAPLVLSAEGHLIFAGRAVRSFAFGWLSVILALYLARRGLTAGEIGLVFTATMVEDAVLTVFLSTMAGRFGPARVMAATAPLVVLGGIALAVQDGRLVLFAGAVLGTLSPNGLEAGSFSPMEQALLPGTVRSGPAVRAFGWFNVVSFLPAALGAAAGGAVLGIAMRNGVDELRAQQMMLLIYAGLGVVLTFLCVRLAARIPHGPSVALPARPGSFGLGRSRAAVLQLAGLQIIDALAGGFIIQSLLAYWFHLRFGVGPEALGALFFGTNLLSALSFLVATRVAERIGLLNTMVFTHLPSNVLLLLVPFMPSFKAAAAVLLARHLLSQMDVPTRQAFTVALVAPEERAAAAGITTSGRALAQACAPALTGLTMAVAATPLPFLLAGGLKIVYDLALFFRFRSVRLDLGPGPGKTPVTTAVVVVFFLVYLGMILGGLPFLQLDRTGVALLGAIALIAMEALSPEQAARSIHLPTVILLFAFMVISAQLRLGGFYERITVTLAGFPLARVFVRPRDLPNE